MPMKTVAVIPAYNEQKYIADVIKNTKKYVDTVIVVDDGSADLTSNVSKEADIVARHVINMGKGTALRTGFEAAIAKGADIVVTIDADGQNDSREIPLLVTALQRNQLDIVV